MLPPVSVAAARIFIGTGGLGNLEAPNQPRLSM